jgi:hypothetical protein
LGDEKVGFEGGGGEKHVEFDLHHDGLKIRMLRESGLCGEGW